jgi:hypothetical protein
LVGRMWCEGARRAGFTVCCIKWSGGDYLMGRWREGFEIREGG